MHQGVDLGASSVPENTILTSLTPSLLQCVESNSVLVGSFNHSLSHLTTFLFNVPNVAVSHLFSDLELGRAHVPQGTLQVLPSNTGLFFGSFACDLRLLFHVVSKAEQNTRVFFTPRSVVVDGLDLLGAEGDVLHIAVLLGDFGDDAVVVPVLVALQRLIV